MSETNYFLHLNTFNPKELGLKNHWRKFSKEHKPNGIFLKPAINVAAPLIGMAVEGETKNRQLVKLQLILYVLYQEVKIYVSKKKTGMDCELKLYIMFQIQFSCTCIVGLLYCEVVKRYSKCKVVCLKSFFHEQSAAKVGLHSHGKSCRKRNYDENREKSKKYYLEYRDKSKNFYLKNRDRINEYYLRGYDRIIKRHKEKIETELKQTLTSG